MTIDVQALCLAVLWHGPASGYEIKKALTEGPYAFFYRASFGSIYPALTRLHAAGDVTVEAREQDRRPDKKVHTITAAGRARLVAALNRPPAPDYFRSDFVLMLFHADLLSPTQRRVIIDERIAWLHGQLRMMNGPVEAGDETACRAGTGAQLAWGLGLAVYEAELAFLERIRPTLIEHPGTELVAGEAGP